VTRVDRATFGTTENTITFATHHPFDDSTFIAFDIANVFCSTRANCAGNWHRQASTRFCMTLPARKNSCVFTAMVAQQFVAFVTLPGPATDVFGV
jgi:hypothetical protein